MCGGIASIFGELSLQFRHDVIIRRKLPRFVLGIDRVPVHGDVKNAAASRDQLGLEARRLPNRVRQTGGFRLVVSLRAIGDRYLHLVVLLTPIVAGARCASRPIAAACREVD
jgi:hypothetical protein